MSKQKSTNKENKVRQFFDRYNKVYYLLIPLICGISVGISGRLEPRFGFLCGVVCGLIFAFLLKKLILAVSKNTTSYDGGNYSMDNRQSPKNTYAHKLMTVAKISWIAITIGGGFGGFWISSSMNDDYMTLGIILGLAAGALVGFLTNLFIMSFAEIGENTRRSAENRHLAANYSADELVKYKKLLDDGVITPEEFESKKKQIMNL